MAAVRDTAAALSSRRVVDELRKLILSGEYVPGERIAQEALAQRFSASRMPVRDALRQLESEGLVTIVAHSGAWVSKLDAFEFDQTYKLREVVEPLAIRESVPNLSAEKVDRISALAEEISTLTAGPFDVQDFLQLDREFHLLTYAGVEYGYLNDVVLRMWNTTQQYRRLLIQKLTPAELAATNADHHLIADAVRRRDAEAAATMVGLHLRRTRKTIATNEALLA